ncbi:S100P-binding protein [Spea bombifrons]|uniref:S100P-binding protein n=1 Tax=Spea bombifrons TaxID=233779 RepID=UPI00234ADE72|nr:S100P-binding protein [Spea bombifrons]XP_053310751.1 S100P-binding protein [Spea bombifrons]
MENSCDDCGWTSPKENSDRQVVFCLGNLQPDSMKAMRIRIVNERATGTKHKLEEVTTLSPSPKRIHTAVFSCSTPCSSSRLQAYNCPLRTDFAPCTTDVSPCHNLNVVSKQSNEWDDSLLDLSDNESDSPLYLTVDQIESLLEDDSCCTAEPSGWESEVEVSKQTVIQVPSDRTLLPLKSQNCDVENNAPHPKQEDSTLIGTVESEEEDNYAAMIPSPCPSLPSNELLDEVPRDNSSDLYTMRAPSPCKSVVERLILDSGSGASSLPNNFLHQPGFNMGDTTRNQGSTACATKVPCITNTTRMGSDVAEIQSEGSDLPFDCDIDDILALSPGDSSSAEEDCTLVVYPSCQKLGLDMSDSTVSTVPSNSLQLPSSFATVKASDNPQLPFSFNNRLCPKVLPIAMGKSSILAEQTVITDSCSLKQNGQEVDPGRSVVSPDQPSLTEVEQENKSVEAPPSIPDGNYIAENQNPSPESSSVARKTSVVPVKPETRKLGSVAPLPKPTFRPQVSLCQLKENQKQYFDRVEMHLDGLSTSEDPNYELASLLNRISREHPSWQHPSDFTRRNHPRTGRKRSKWCTLDRWVLQNGGNKQRFQDLPCTFQRSPIPDVLPSRPL